MKNPRKSPKKQSNNPKLLNLILSTLFSFENSLKMRLLLLLLLCFTQNFPTILKSDHRLVHISLIMTLSPQHKLKLCSLSFSSTLRAHHMKLIREFSFSNFFSCVCCFLECDCLRFVLITKIFCCLSSFTFFFIFICLLTWLSLCVEFHFSFSLSSFDVNWGN